jgi:hypothetical protein
MLGRQESRLAKPPRPRRIPHRRTEQLPIHRKLPCEPPRQNPTAHARGKSPPSPLLPLITNIHALTHSLRHQIVWDTTPFNNKADWPADGSQPFYLSTGDNTGYGQHGDYVFGWKDDALQKAMDANGCFSATCGGLKTQDIGTANKCVIKKTVQEDTEGCEYSLGGVEWSGWRDLLTCMCRVECASGYWCAYEGVISLNVHREVSVWFDAGGVCSCNLRILEIYSCFKTPTGVSDDIRPNSHPHYMQA